MSTTTTMMEETTVNVDGYYKTEGTVEQALLCLSPLGDPDGKYLTTQNMSAELANAVMPTLMRAMTAGGYKVHNRTFDVTGEQVPLTDSWFFPAPMPTYEGERVLLTLRVCEADGYIAARLSNGETHECLMVGTDPNPAEVVEFIKRAVELGDTEGRIQIRVDKVCGCEHEGELV